MFSGAKQTKKSSNGNCRYWIFPATSSDPKHGKTRVSIFGFQIHENNQKWCLFDFDRRFLSMMRFYYQPIKISEQPCYNGEPKRHTVLWEGIRTTHKLILRVPHGSRPHGYDRRLTLCVNDPTCWKSTPVLQSITVTERGP